MTDSISALDELSDGSKLFADSSREVSGHASKGASPQIQEDRAANKIHSNHNDAFQDYGGASLSLAMQSWQEESLANQVNGSSNSLSPMANPPSEEGRKYSEAPQTSKNVTDANFVIPPLKDVSHGQMRDETARSIVAEVIHSATTSLSDRARIESSKKESVEVIDSPVLPSSPTHHYVINPTVEPIESKMRKPIKEVPLSHKLTKSSKRTMSNEVITPKKRKERSIFIIKKKDKRSSWQEVPLVERFMTQVQQDAALEAHKKNDPSGHVAEDFRMQRNTVAKSAHALSIVRPMTQILKSMTSSSSPLDKPSSPGAIGSSRSLTEGSSPLLQPLRNKSYKTMSPHTAPGDTERSTHTLGPVADFLKLRRDGTDPRSHTQITPNGVVLVRTRPRVMCYGAGRVVSLDPAAFASGKVDPKDTAELAAELRQTATAFRGKSPKANNSQKVKALRQQVVQNSLDTVGVPSSVPPSERRVLYEVPI